MFCLFRLFILQWVLYKKTKIHLLIYFQFSETFSIITSHCLCIDSISYYHVVISQDRNPSATFEAVWPVNEQHRPTASYYKNWRNITVLPARTRAHTRTFVNVCRQHIRPLWALLCRDDDIHRIPSEEPQQRSNGLELSLNVFNLKGQLFHYGPLKCTTCS